MKKLIVIILLFVSILCADEIVDVWGRTATGKYLGVENSKILFKITGVAEPNIFNPETIASLTIGSTGQKYDNHHILELAGITKEQNSPRVTDKPDTKTINLVSSANIYNPCKDELFLKIKQKELDEMSEREYQYFLQKDKECSEFAKKNSYQPPQNEENTTLSIMPESLNQNETNDTDYYIKGSTTAESEFNSSAALGGLLCGLGGGIIGWGIGAAVIQSMDVDVPYHSIKGLDTEQQYQFKSGFKEKVKKIRKTDFNTGAAIGTIGIVVILLVSGS